MNVCFVLDPSARERPEVRWTVAQLAPLLDAPWRVASDGAPRGEDELVAFVGDPAAAPPGAVAVIPAAWPAWDPPALALATFDGAPLVCPGGACPPPGSGRELPAPWLRSIFFLLSREEELLDPRRDRWECYSGDFTRLRDLGVLGEPLVDVHAAQLRARLDAGARARGRTLPRVPRWKGGAPFAAALGHDVDDVRLHSFGLALRLLRQGRPLRDFAVRHGLLAPFRRGPDPYASFDRWTREEEARGFRSTFYVFAPRPARRHPDDAAYAWDDRLAFDGGSVTVRDLLRRLHGRGFEIGLHGSYLSHRDGAELAGQRRQVERELGAPVLGIRQHFLRFDRGATWESQDAAGFETDATLGYNETPGFRAGVAAPFHPWNPAAGRGHRLLELPLTCMDVALFRIEPGPDAATAAALRHLERVESVGGMAGLLWHPNVAAREHFPGWWECFVASLDRLRERGAWVAPARDIAAWWAERGRSLALEAAGAGA